MKTSLALALVAVAVSACGSGPANDGQGETPSSTSAATSSAAVTSPQTGAAPSFDCTKADADAAKIVCDDPELARLDVQLAAEYEHALAGSGADTAALTATQNGWVTGRDDCWKADDPHRCILEAYRTRLFELKVDDPDTVQPQTVIYRCPDPTKPFTARFYNQFDPPVAVLTRGTDSATVFAEQSGSGARYGRDGVEFWEHQGEVTVDFYGDEFVCTTP